MTGVNNFDGALYLRDVRPNILQYSDINTFVLTREEFIGIAISAVVIDIIKPKNIRTALIADELLNKQYTDWQHPNESATLLFSVTNMSSDVAFFYPAVSTVKGHASLGKGKSYLYELSVVPTTHALETPNWIYGI
ncbi:hypothetical protein DPMN_055735 [Dreissena polymorpha]|uniref:Uncharacterized protein n=1 Tax=Dreissena polymorpha TaxID=45954 RepID=A0A9D4CSC9_DREPO|nr:hypothetical protein DPMN_055735 [Dreissena polymorpha]